MLSVDEEVLRSIYDFITHEIRGLGNAMDFIPGFDELNEIVSDEDKLKEMRMKTVVVAEDIIRQVSEKYRKYPKLLKFCSHRLCDILVYSFKLFLFFTVVIIKFYVIRRICSCKFYVKEKTIPNMLMQLPNCVNI